MSKNILCPKCSQPATQVGSFWICPQHGQLSVTDIEMTESQDKKGLKIFLSYGHDIFAEDVKKIKEDLEARGHEVWYDVERLQAGDDFGTYIEQGLKWCDKVVVVMTPHSVRRLDPYDPDSTSGFCLGEIAKALEFHKLVIPVYLVFLPDGPPQSICHILYLDMRDCVHFKDFPEKYHSHFELLVEAIEKNRIDFEGAQSRLKMLLEPLSFDAEFGRYLSRFTGRDWISYELDKWLVDKPDSRVFWLLGEAGVGKSAIACHWIHERTEVIAHHLCVHGHEDKADPKRILLSLAGCMAAALPEYFQRLSKLRLEEEVKKSAKTVFDNLILAPLRRNFPAPDGDRLVIIDGLDEASHDGENELAAFIAESWGDLPRWLRLVVTSRPEESVVKHLSVFDPHKLQADRKENLQDIRKYITRELAEMGLKAHEGIVNEIIDKSEGLFLYVKLVLDDIQAGKLSLDHLADFPKGMTNYYERWFSREFPDEKEYQEKYHHIVSTIVAQRAPLPLHVLSGAVGINLHELQQRLARLRVLFPLMPAREGNKPVVLIRALHRSLLKWVSDFDELTHLPKAAHFAADVELGETLFADQGWIVYQAGDLAESPYYSKTLLRHLTAAGKQEKLWQVLFNPALLNSLWSKQMRCEWLRHLSHLRTQEPLGKILRSWLAEHETEQKPMEWATSIARLSWLLQEAGAWDEGLCMAGEALRIWDAHSVSDSPEMVQCLLAMGNIHRGRDQHNKAVEELQRALAIAELAYGPESRDTAEVLYHLCVVETKRRQYQEAWNYLDRCQKIYEQCDPPEYAWLATCVNDRAVLLAGKGIPDDYLAIYQEALTLFEKCGWEGHPEMACTLTNIAWELEKKEENARAVEYYKRGLATAEFFLMPHSPRCQELRERLAYSFIRNKMYQEALDLLRAIVDQMNLFPGPVHDDTASAKLSLCRIIYYVLWLNEKAHRAQLCWEFLNISEAIQSASPSTCIGFLDLGSNLHKVGETKLSELAIETAKRAALGNAARDWKEPAERESARLFADTLECAVSNLPMTDIVQECWLKWEKSAPIMQQGADCLAKTRRQIVNLITWTGSARLERKRDVAAVEEAFKLISDLGADSTETLDQLAVLTVILHHYRHYAASEALCERLVKRSETLLGKQHIQTLTYISNLADLSEHQGKFKEAEHLWQRAFEGRQIVFGTVHNDTLSSLGMLAECLLACGKTGEARKLVREYANNLPETPAGKSARITLADLLNRAAITLKNEFRAYEAARHSYELSLELNTVALVHSNLALLCWSCLGDTKAAEEHFTKAIGIGPEKAGLLSNYGLFLTHATPDYKRARKYFKKAIDLAPHEGAYSSNYATLAIIEGDLDKAWDLSHRAMKLELVNRDRLLTRPLFCAAVIFLLQEKDPSIPLGQLRQLFTDGIDHAPWVITNLLKLCDERLDPESAELLRRISSAIDDGEMLHQLETMPRWQVIEPVSLDTQWPDIK